MYAVAVTWADQMIAISTTIQAVAVACALVIALYQLRAAREGQQQSSADARIALEATTRPYVVVDVDAQTDQGFIYFVVVNAGQSAAQNVRFAFAPSLTSAFAVDEGRDPMDSLRPLRDGITTLAPGRSISLLFDYAIGRYGNSAKMDHDNRYTVEVSYSGTLGDYNDRYVLDVGMYRDTEYIDRKGLHEIGLALDTLAKEIKGWTAHPGGGVHVRSDHDLREATAERRLTMEEHRRRVEERRRKQAEAQEAGTNDEDDPRPDYAPPA